jgi:hypothetical protein
MPIMAYTLGSLVRVGSETSARAVWG